MALGGCANLTACSPTRTMAGSSGAATSSTYRDTDEYSSILAGRVGVYYPYRLYAYRYAPGIGLPPYREWPARPGRTVRGTVRSNPKRSYLDSFRLFWKSRGKSTRGFGPWTPGDSWSTRRSSLDTRHVIACRDRLQLFLCLVVENWIMWDGCSVFGAAQPLASPCQGEGDRRRRWKGGYVAKSTIVTIELPSTSPPPSHGFAVPAPLGKGGREV